MLSPIFATTLLMPALSFFYELLTMPDRTASRIAWLSSTTRIRSGKHAAITVEEASFALHFRRSKEEIRCAIGDRCRSTRLTALTVPAWDGTPALQQREWI